MSVTQQMLLDGFVAIAAERDEQAVLEAVVDVARRALQARYGAAVLVDANGITSLAHAGLTTRQAERLSPLPRGLDALRHPLTEGAPIRLEGLHDPGAAGFPLAHVPAAAYLGVPITCDGVVLGALHLSKPRGKGAFTAADELLAGAFGRQAGQAVTTARTLVTTAQLTAQLAAAEQLKARALASLSSEMAATTSIAQILAAAREGLDMELACVASLDDGVQRFDHVSGDAGDLPLCVGTELDAATSYCDNMMGGRLAGVLADTLEDPLAVELPATQVHGVRAYAGVPITVDGRTYGTLCCFSRKPQRGLSTKDLSFLSVLAQLVGEELSRLDRERAQQRRRVADIRGLFARNRHTLVTQPIVDIAAGVVVGVEALSRFGGGEHPPDAVFADADAVGLSGELELLALRRALDLLHVLPEHLYLSCNLSPATITRPDAAAVFRGHDGGRVVVELTEHAEVKDYDALREVLADLRSVGVRVAVDDAGSGFASLRHIVSLQPDIIKIDLALTRGIDGDPARRALAGALAGFAAEQGAVLVAEGVETEGELATLRSLGVRYAQGYHLGRPAPIGQLLSRERSALRKYAPTLAASAANTPTE